MAQSVRLVLIDDVDGTEADQTVTFALDGESYEIDLNDQHRPHTACGGQPPFSRLINVPGQYN